MSGVVDEVARLALLKDAGKAAKLTDPALLQLAKPGLAPADAVADLKQRYPAGFEPEKVKQFSEMSRDEQDEFERKHLGRSRPWWQQ